MSSENNQWDLADQELNLWMTGDKNEINFSFTDILKSTYLSFRQKHIERFSIFCQQAFEYHQEQERRGAQIRYSLEDTPMFRKIDLSKSEQKARTFKENQEIINGILSGDQQVFNDLYEDEFPKAVRFIIQNSGRADMAKDVFQDALVIFIEKVYTKKLDLTCSVSTYLYSICRFLWMDQLRQNKREMPLSDNYSYLKDDITVVGFDDATPDIYENVNSAIEKLGDSCKQLLESYYYKSLSWDEIASSLGYASAASARNQKYKCLERIRSMVNVEVE
ncbi:MAG TPA: sigma-70 family RNA polymerase sigma factor [Prolixibacteraceae bacterium]|nr:sigma-70 family RNA polymerase sigma factor [Prolixibacteraceae bacterium]